MSQVHNDQAPDEIERARQALTSLNLDDEEYIPALNTLADGLLSRFSLSRNPNDIDEAVSLIKQALDLALPGHSSRLTVMCTGGRVYNTRYRFRGDTGDMTQALSCFEAALELCAPDRDFYLPVVANLASSLRNRYQTFGDVRDLDRTIDILSTALSSTGTSPTRDALLNNLANALKQRFEKLGNRADLDVALMHYQSCLDLRPPGHPLRHSVLGNFADGMLYKFEVDSHLQDLESASSYLASALELRSPGQDGYLFYLTSLGVVFWRLFNAQGDAEKLEVAIGHFQTAMAHSTVPNLDHSRLLDNYSAALQTRYTLFGNIDDLDQAIRYLTMSSEIQPPGYPGRPITLLNLGAALANHFGATGHMAYINSAIEKLASAIQLAGPDHQYRSAMLSAYCHSLSMRFGQKGDVQDLKLAASKCEEALALVSPNSVTYPSIVANLTVTLMECFHKSGNIEECRIIIDHCDRALAFVRPADPACLVLKFTRCKAFLQLFQHGRERAHIETCIDAFREVIPTLYEGHAEYVPMHMQFGIALQMRFDLDSDLKDLDDSIAAYRVAHRSCKRGDLDYVSIRMQLGNALVLSFEFNRDLGDTLDEAIVLLTEAKETLALTPGHSDHKASLFNLGTALHRRFAVQRDKIDLDMAIELASHALSLPTSSTDFLVSAGLATLISVRYNEFKDMADLERCVELYTAAAKQMPPKHLQRGVLCQHYGRALYKLGVHRNCVQHLNDAIDLLNEAIKSLPELQPDQLVAYAFLAQVLAKRAILLKSDEDAVHAASLLHNVMQRLSEDNPAFQTIYHTAAELSMDWYELSEKEGSFMENGFRYFEKAARYTHFHSFQSVNVALQWTQHAEEYHHSSALLAYQTALASLNQHLFAIASLKGRHAALVDRLWVKNSSTLAVNATSCAIARGELELAIELSEQGRGLLWAQLSQSQTPLDDLRSSSAQGCTLASEFERLSTQLAQSAIGQTESNNFLTSSRLTVEDGVRQYRRLSKELEDVVRRIRQQEGFQSFLDRPKFNDLKRAAISGPIILVNASRQRCDALIVLYDAPPRLVPLPDASFDDLAALSEQLYEMLGAIYDEKRRERNLIVILRALWDAVVSPIVEELTTFIPRGTRIWWCPTSKLTSLPLHAAGPYRKGESNLANTYVSSYTPTLAALIRARQKHPFPAPAFVAIGQATPASGSELSSVDAELHLVASLVPREMRLAKLSGDAATADAALAALSTHGWVHMACHGLPDANQPFSSAFALRDREVTVLDVVRARARGGGGGGHASESAFNATADAVNASASVSASVDADVNAATTTTTATAAATGKPTGDFAFLSACHTTAGDSDAPDETIHLAAAMQFAGFRSVIGTMWAVDDGTAHAMVGGFYTQLSALAEGQEWDCTQAARALNKAARTVDKALVSIDQRIVFIHIGA